MNSTLKNTLIAMATAALGFGCGGSSEEPAAAETSTGGEEATEASCGAAGGSEAACGGAGTGTAPAEGTTEEGGEASCGEGSCG